MNEGNKTLLQVLGECVKAIRRCTKENPGYGIGVVEKHSDTAFEFEFTYAIGESDCRHIFYVPRSVLQKIDKRTYTPDDFRNACLPSPDAGEENSKDRLVQELPSIKDPTEEPRRFETADLSIEILDKDGRKITSWFDADLCILVHRGQGVSLTKEHLPKGSKITFCIKPNGRHS